MSEDQAVDGATTTLPLDGAAVDRLAVSLPDRYAARRLLGHGGQGVVWLAEDRELGERVAIKVLARLDAVAAERVRREVRLCRRLRHANLAEIYELIEAGESFAVVMEHLPGGSLSDRLGAGPLPVDGVIAIARSLLAALAHLHGAGIVHRDVKPSNVLFAADGTAKLADFGLLRTVESDRNLTRTGMTVGTPAYMSPEQIRGAEPEATSDLYSLGVTLYELLAGRPPFVAISALEVAHQHLSRHPERLRARRPECPRWLATFVERLLAKDPRRRWRDAALALAAFEHRRPGLSRRGRRALVAAGVTAVALGALAFSAGRLRGGDAIDGRVEGSTLVVRDARGRELWRRRPEAVRLFAVGGDVRPAPGPEVVTAEVAESAGIRSTELVVRDRRGVELRREPADHQDVARHFPQFTRSFTTNLGPRLADLDRDGLDDVLLPLAHSQFYPAMVLLWQPSSDRRSAPLLVNSGHVTDLRVADLDRDGRPELIVAGLNNILGFQSVVAVVGIDATSPLDDWESRISPDLLSITASGRPEGAELRAYTMLGESRGTARIDRADAGGISIRMGSSVVRLDPDGNPEGSPLWGRGGGARRSLWTDCRDVQLEAARAPERSTLLIAEFEQRNGAALAEPATRDAVLILLARGLGDADRPDLGAAVLERADRGQATNRRVWRQRGELLLLAGRRAEAHAVLEHAVAAGDRGAQPLDELVILALDAAVHGDRTAFERSLRRWQRAVGERATIDLVTLAPLRAFFAGSWVDAHPAGARWNDALFHLQALTEWAALEDGAPAAEVLESLAPIAGRPEARDLCHLVRARALMLDGDPHGAADLALQALIGLESRARRSYEDFLWEGVAHWVRGAALDEAGKTAAARADLTIAARRLPATWLGGDARRRLHRPPAAAAPGG